MPVMEEVTVSNADFLEEEVLVREFSVGPQSAPSTEAF
jgi:hypothetical protein